MNINNNISAILVFESSTIERAEYDYRTFELALDLPTGLYYYEDVPPHVFEGLVRADSKGRFFNEYIKKGNYKFNK